MKLKKIVTFLLLTISTCALTLENTSNTPVSTDETTSSSAPIIPIYLFYHYATLETENGALANDLKNLANNHEAYQLYQPKIVIMNSVLAYPFLAGVYQHFTDLGYQLHAEKTTEILDSVALHKRKDWPDLFFNSGFFPITNFYITINGGEKFLIAVFNPGNRYFQPNELFNKYYVKQIELPSQSSEISSEEQTQLAETVDELYQSIQWSSVERLETLSNNFIHIFNPATSYALKFFIDGHGGMLESPELENENIHWIAGMHGTDFGQFLIAINTLPTADFVLWTTCRAGGSNAERVAEFLERNCPDRKFGIAAFPALDRLSGNLSIKNGTVYQANKKSLEESIATSFGTVAYLAPAAKRFKILTLNKKALLHELTITTNESKKYGLSAASVDLIRDYEKEHGCELFSYFAQEAAKNNNSALFVQIFRSFPDRLNSKLFITCLRLLAEHGNLADITFLLTNYPNPIDQEQREEILELAKQNDLQKKST